LGAIFQLLAQAGATASGADEFLIAWCTRNNETNEKEMTHTKEGDRESEKASRVGRTCVRCPALLGDEPDQLGCLEVVKKLRRMQHRTSKGLGPANRPNA
jgi:hypothetical protein